MQDEFDINLFNVQKDGLHVPSNTSFEKTVTFLGPVIGLPTGGGGSWGNIDGDINSQSDLHDALQNKLSISFAANAHFSNTIYVNGGASVNGSLVTEQLTVHGNSVFANTVTFQGPVIGITTKISTASNRSELAGINNSLTKVVFLQENGREGLFKWNSNNLSSAVSADTLQGIYVAPSSDSTGASGAWVRSYDGDAWLHWWGAPADFNGTTGTDCYPAIICALATLLAKSGVVQAPYQVASPRLRIGPGKRYFSQQIEVRQTIIIEGEGVGFAAPCATELYFPNTGCGFIVERENTSGGSGSGVTPSQNAGDGATFWNIAVNFTGTAPATPADDAEYHGFLLRARGEVRGCQVSNARGDGVKVEADSLGENSNGSVISHFKAFNCRHALYVVGGDANACRSEHVDGIFCRRFTIRDDSFLGCYHGPVSQALANGVPFNGYGVNYSGYSYTVMPGLEEEARTHAPSGTTADNDYWSFVANGTQVNWSTWTSGMSRTEASGAFYLSGAGGNAGSVLEFAYAENSQGPTICNTPARVNEGVAAGRVRGTGTVSSTSSGGAAAFTALRLNDKNAINAYATLIRSGGRIRFVQTPDGVVSVESSIEADGSFKGNGFIFAATSTPPTDNGAVWFDGSKLKKREGGVISDISPPLDELLPQTGEAYTAVFAVGSTVSGRIRATSTSGSVSFLRATIALVVGKTYRFQASQFAGTSLGYYSIDFGSTSYNGPSNPTVDTTFVATSTSIDLYLFLRDGPGGTWAPNGGYAEWNLSLMEIKDINVATVYAGKFKARAGLVNAADDAAAATAGVAVNEFYRNGSVVMIRVS